MKKNISRKKFISVTVAGLAGIKLQPLINQDHKNDLLTKGPVGRTGILVSAVGFGASRTNEESLIKYALGKGINFIDTGRAYNNGNNERLVGKAISGIRNDVVIQSKIRLDKNDVPSEGKGRRGAEEIRNILNLRTEESLKALNTNYIDILLYHDAWDQSLLFHQEVMKFFDDMKSSGVIRAHGFSTHNDLIHLHERNNREGFYDVIMVPFNHKGSFVHSVTGKYSEWDQTRLITALTEAGNKGIGIIAMKTCSGGKYSPSPDVGPGFREAVRWVTGHPYISSAAVAMASFEQVDEYIQA